MGERNSESDSDAHSSVITARIAVLTLGFEATRARLLSMPASPVHASGTLFVDAGVRPFLIDGLARAAPYVVFVLSVRRWRYASSKFRDEPEIPKRSNRPSSPKTHFYNDTQPLFNHTQVVVLTIRAICQSLHICIREPDARRLLKRALATAGLQDSNGLVLFGASLLGCGTLLPTENVLLPHGSGTERALRHNDLVLVECGGFSAW
ncbi:hypothetical protein BJV74DRAFT_883290 [Russula compacta]|nr:hypothetical protein BJV74DRAFT_883290 [Russula compacta]